MGAQKMRVGGVDGDHMMRRRLRQERKAQ